MKTIFKTYLSILAIFILFGCSSEIENSIQIKIQHEGEPLKGASVFVKEMLPIEFPGFSVFAYSDSSGTASFNHLKDDMYEVWIAKPGYEEIRQRLSLNLGENITINLDLPRKNIPDQLDQIYAFGTFNQWDYTNSIKLHKGDDNIWRGKVQGVKSDSIIYALYLDVPYHKYYNPNAQGLKYVEGSQPAYLSIAYPEGEDSLFYLIFDENQFEHTSVPFFSNWVKREISSVEGPDFVAFEKLITAHFENLSETLFTINDYFIKIERPSQADYKRASETLLGLFKKHGTDEFIIQLREVAYGDKGDLADLAKLELARIYRLYWMHVEANSVLNDIDIDGFAGGETLRGMEERFNGTAVVMSSYLKSQLEKVKGPEARYAILKLKLKADTNLREKEAVIEDFEMIIDEFPDSELAEQGREFIDKN